MSRDAPKLCEGPYGTTKCETCAGIVECAETERSHWEWHSRRMESALTVVEDLIQDLADETNLWVYYPHQSVERRAYEKLRLALGDVQDALEATVPAHQEGVKQG